jgi:mono/diheme cytochrome c family protein
MKVACQARRTYTRRAGLSFAAGLCSVFVLLGVPGCSTPEYPPELTYPLRNDWLVGQPPTCTPPEPDEPGQLDKALARINELGGKAYNPAELTDGQRASVQEVLLEAFGTPSQPKMDGDDEVQALAHDLTLQPERLAEGSRLYRRHCLQCHGLGGDGRGPTGPWIFPHPRDFRQGVFKWISSDSSQSRKPSRDDLARTIRSGIEGTSMPSFGLLRDADIDLLISYIMHLSIRGEVEYRLLLAVLADGEPCSGDFRADVRKSSRQVLLEWQRAQVAAIAPNVATPDDDDARMSSEHLESVGRGHRLFTDAKLNSCISCHEDYGRQSKPRFDAWGTQVRPADLTAGVYRGGKRPLDLFRRVRCGIGPSGMPAVTAMSDGELWDLVHFVQALPYPRMLPEDVREKVYPKSPPRGAGGE